MFPFNITLLVSHYSETPAVLTILRCSYSYWVDVSDPLSFGKISDPICTRTSLISSVFLAVIVLELNKVVFSGIIKSALVMRSVVYFSSSFLDVLFSYDNEFSVSGLLPFLW